MRINEVLPELPASSPTATAWLASWGSSWHTATAHTPPIYPHPHAPAIYPEPSTLNPKPSTVTQVLGPEVLAFFIVVDMQKPSGLLASIACALAKELD